MNNIEPLASYQPVLSIKSLSFGQFLAEQKKRKFFLQCGNGIAAGFLSNGIDKKLAGVTT